MVVYCITNIINGHQYVGQTSGTVQARLRSHMKSKNCWAIHHALKKYGLQNFKVHELARAQSQEMCDSLEEYFICVLGCQRPYGYNILQGGSKRVMSEENKRRMSESQKSAMLDMDLRAKRISYLARSWSRPGRKGKPALNRKKVRCITNGELYESVTSAAMNLSLDVSSVSAVANARKGMRQTGGFSFAWE